MAIVLRCSNHRAVRKSHLGRCWLSHRYCLRAVNKSVYAQADRGVRPWHLHNSLVQAVLMHTYLVPLFQSARIGLVYKMIASLRKENACRISEQKAGSFAGLSAFCSSKNRSPSVHIRYTEHTKMRITLQAHPNASAPYVSVQTMPHDTEG